MGTPATGPTQVYPSASRNTAARAERLLAEFEPEHRPLEAELPRILGVG
ncbi:hypothetical protein ODE01S_02420 [Oceanithermus desulfurans NBRC 100063]|uniref:Uncharacterized protein n=1 Tax=Oceanithermus desulfurans NBRC 100063 TaxID=1227550 RepID=A0A511RGP0_9DEIN|nr:hypothetical protein ODE01S_02420 [Oceanithermus desulfurans NBRC 100063]